MDGEVSNTLNALTGTITPTGSITGELTQTNNISGTLSIPVAKTYYDLCDKPVLNGVIIEGDRVSEDYRLQSKIDVATEQDIDNMLFFGGN